MAQLEVWRLCCSNALQRYLSTTTFSIMNLFSTPRSIPIEDLYLNDSIRSFHKTSSYRRHRRVSAARDGIEASQTTDPHVPLLPPFTPLRISCSCSTEPPLQTKKRRETIVRTSCLPPRALLETEKV